MRKLVCLSVFVLGLSAAPVFAQSGGANFCDGATEESATRALATAEGTMIVAQGRVNQASDDYTNLKKQSDTIRFNLGMVACQMTQADFDATMGALVSGDGNMADANTSLQEAAVDLIAAKGADAKAQAAFNNMQWAACVQNAGNCYEAANEAWCYATISVPVSLSAASAAYNSAAAIIAKYQP